MIFLSVVLRYLTFAVPLVVLGFLLMILTGWSQRLVTLGLAVVNLGILGYVAYWGWHEAGLSVLRSLLYTGVTFYAVAMLVPVVFTVAARVARRRGGPPSEDIQTP